MPRKTTASVSSPYKVTTPLTARHAMTSSGGRSHETGGDRLISTVGRVAPSGGGQTQKRPDRSTRPGRSLNYPGSDLLSHAVAHAVPSAQEGLTSVFGMGTGVAPPATPPGIESYRRPSGA